jgi:hypothetical protein
VRGEGEYQPLLFLRAKIWKGKEKRGKCDGKRRKDKLRLKG